MASFFLCYLFYFSLLSIRNCSDSDFEKFDLLIDSVEEYVNSSVRVESCPVENYIDHIEVERHDISTMNDDYDLFALVEEYLEEFYNDPIEPEEIGDNCVEVEMESKIIEKMPSASDEHVINDELNLNVKREDVFGDLLKRFRKESGRKTAICIDWKQLDRTEIPEKYKDITINSGTLLISRIFRNPEIVENIHFRPYTEEQLIKKKLMKHNDEIGNNEEYERALTQVLDKFRAETDIQEADRVSWRLLDRSRLPERYINRPITSESFYSSKLYLDPVFLDNVHFGKSPRIRTTKRKRINALV